MIEFYKNLSTRNKTFLVVGILFTVSIIAGAFMDDPSPQKSGYGTVRTDFNASITRALVKQGIRGCGEYRYSQSLSDPSRFKVMCTGDGVSWTTYYLSIY